MTEQEWLVCEHPQPMLEFLGKNISSRRLQLFAVACCRQIWTFLRHKAVQNVVEVTERFIEGEASTTALKAACADTTALDEGDFHDPAYYAVWVTGSLHESACGFADTCDVCSKANQAVFDLAWNSVKANRAQGTRAKQAEARANVHVADQTRFLRDIIGDPFRPVSVDPSWRTNNVVSLARAIYDERAFERLPILADALEEASCTSADVLAHCRGLGPHVRGCWVVDLLLDRR